MCMHVLLCCVANCCLADPQMNRSRAKRCRTRKREHTSIRKFWMFSRVLLLACFAGAQPGLKTQDGTYGRRRPQTYAICRQHAVLLREATLITIVLTHKFTTACKRVSFRGQWHDGRAVQDKTMQSLLSGCGSVNPHGLLSC